MCLTDYIGIRGECQDAKIYLDDLPGINIENVADIAEGFERPLEVVRKAFTLAVDQVYTDWINQVKDHFDYKEILGKVIYKNAGTEYLYGGDDEVAKITLERIPGDYMKTSLKSISIYSENGLSRTFYIKDRFGQVIKEVSANITSGYNKVLLDVESDSDLVIIEFNLDGLTIGAYNQPIATTWSKSSACGGCVSNCGCMQVYVDKTIGFDLECSCVVDRCALIDYFLNSLRVPLLYKTGINYFLAVKGTSRVNAYTRNSKEQIDYFLNQWQGGTDMVSGIKTSSAYWQSLKTAADSTVVSLKHMKINAFAYNSTEIINSLPG